MRISRHQPGGACVVRRVAGPIFAATLSLASLAPGTSPAQQYACGSYVPPADFPPKTVYTFDHINLFPSPGGLCAEVARSGQEYMPSWQISSYLTWNGSDAQCHVVGYNGPLDTFAPMLYSKGICPEGYRLVNGYLCGPINPAAPPTVCPTDGSPDPFANLGRPESCDAASGIPILVGNPINARTGNKYQEETDYLGAGAFPLAFIRHYNSYAVARPTLGPRWRHHYDRQVVVEDATHVAVIRPAGQAYEFALTNGAWRSTTDQVDRLQQTSTGWVLQTAADETETYTAAGQLVSITDRAGRVQSLSYSDGSTPLTVAPEQGLLLRVTDPVGRALSFTYDAFSRIATMTDPAGQVYRYSYLPSSSTGAVGPLSAVTYPGPSPAPVRRYSYDHFAGANTKLTYALTGITDENGSTFATYTYDDTGRAISSSHGGESLQADPYHLTYGSDGTTTVANANISRTYGFRTVLGLARAESVTQPCSSCGAASAHDSLDANGFVSAQVDFNGVATSYARQDAAGRKELVTSVTEAVGTSVERTTTTDWDARFRLPARVTRPGLETTYAWDERGNPTRRTDTDTATGTARTWLYDNTYSAPIAGRYEAGQLAQKRIDGPRTDAADVTIVDYFGPDELCSPSATDGSTIGCRGQIARITNALGHETRFNRYNVHGQPEEIVDPNGLTTTLFYDARRRMTARGVGAEITGFTYDGVGQLTRLTLPDGSYLDFTYDHAHRLTQIQDSLGNRVTYTLDAMGNRIKEDAFDPAGQLATTRSRVYDGLNQLIQAIGGTNPAAQVTGYDYDAQGNLIRIVDPLDRATTQAFDALNRVVSIVDPAYGRTQLAYDALDQLRVVTDPRGLTTSYRANAVGDLEQQVSPDTGPSASTHDAAGNLLTRTDARGVAASYTYDALDRVTQVTFTPPAGSGLAKITHTYEYDQGPNGLGRLTRITDPTGTTQYTYDAQGRVTQDVRTIRGITYITAYQYDSAGRLTRLTYPSGRTVDYSYDGAGRVRQIDTSYANLTQPVVSGAAYHPLGGVSSFLFGNATRYERTFDLDGRITNHTVGTTTRTLGYDAASRLTAFAHPDPALNQAFGYDSLDRLTSWVAASTNQSYTYDANGNRTSATYGAQTYGYSYGGTSNRLDTVAGPVTLAYTYDAAGNPTSDGVRSFVYDARGRLRQIVSGTKKVAFGINALGQRVTKRRLAFHFDSAGRLIAESDAAGEPLREYIYLDDLPVAMVTFDHDGDGIRDPVDNCILDYNPNQLDASGDGFGNRCDGDANGDGALTSDDVVLINRIISGKVPADPAVIARADLTGDGTLTSPDASQVRRKVNGGRTAPGPSGPKGHWSGPELFFIHPDHLGTPRVVVDIANRVHWRWDHATPFGDTQADDSYVQNGVTLPYQQLRMNLRFPGQQYDAETGLHYNYYRDYDPASGRYLQPDPIGLQGGINVYQYVEGNALRYVDPYGLFGWPGMPPLPEGFVDFSAGMGDVILFGQGQKLRDLGGIDGGVDPGSDAYSAGEWAGVATSVATGLAGGLKAAGAKGAGLEFSHWIPARVSGPRSLWNGNFVPTTTHALSDPYRYRFMPRAWKAENPLPHWAWQQWVRIPKAYKGAAAGGAYGTAGAAQTGGKCRR
jgi:RHS repeat-associated protein